MNSTKQMIKKLIKEQMTSVLLARPSDDEIIMEQKPPNPAEEAAYNQCIKKGNTADICKKLIGQDAGGQEKAAAAGGAGQAEKIVFQNKMKSLIKQHGAAMPVPSAAKRHDADGTASGEAIDYMFDRAKDPGDLRQPVKTPKYNNPLNKVLQTFNKAFAGRDFDVKAHQQAGQMAMGRGEAAADKAAAPVTQQIASLAARVAKLERA